MNKAKLNSISMAVKFENFQPINNTGFVRGECKVAYAGKNRNYSNIFKESFEKAEPTVFGIPVVGNWLGENYGGHDIVIETKGNEISFKDATTPFGFVPQDANPRWESVEDENGNSKNYYVVDVILWQERYPEQVQFVVDNGANQSIEIMVTDGDWDENWEYFNINDFYYSALCLLGREVDENGKKGESDVEPCFENSEVIVGKFNMTEKFKKDLFAIKSAFKGGENVADENILDEVEETLDDFQVEENEVISEEIITETEITVAEEKFEEETIEDTDTHIEESVEAEQNFEEKYNELLKDFSEMENEYKILESEVIELREFKQVELEKQELFKKNELVSDYSLLLDASEISTVTTEIDKFSLDELKVKLSQIFTDKELEKAKYKADKTKPNDTIIFDNKQKDSKIKKNKFAI